MPGAVNALPVVFFFFLLLTRLCTEPCFATLPSSARGVMSSSETRRYGWVPRGGFSVLTPTLSSL